MLHIAKNNLVTGVARQQVEIRQLELDWYTMNYDTMAVQAAMFAGFAFEQITEPVLPGTEKWVETAYVFLTCASLGFELCVCMSCTFCCIFGKGLALRGPHGARSVHIAVTNLEKEQKLVFTQFVLGILAYLLSQVIKMWIYFRPRIAITVSIPLLIFLFAIIYFVVFIVKELQLDDTKALRGQIGAWAPYERIQDLDEAIYKPAESKQNLYRSGR
mmetsp:Transcript_3471/g.7003  ORF Transcript_3471/g.7003 Transcript_3471/m.7003 type:complete len:216 (-) Transcript_3471:95-742(-)